MFQTFPNDTIFQNDNSPIHTAGAVKSWFEEHEAEASSLASTIIRFEQH
jgi:hypothetical protein